MNRIPLIIALGVACSATFDSARAQSAQPTTPAASGRASAPDCLLYSSSSITLATRIPWAPSRRPREKTATRSKTITYQSLASHVQVKRPSALVRKRPQVGGDSRAGSSVQAPPN
ncbi:MAG TPA: hypothetical protein VKV17_11030 [Bryobacteraceae bacterium]|nr:hypothetical protein [Bryobacteraceae bacterium]